MAQPPTEPLGSHDRGVFHCANEHLNRYLRESALQDQKKHASVCWVLPNAPDQPTRIKGYYTLSSYSVLLPDLPEEMRKKLPRYPTVPAALLGRLAVDDAFRGQGLGEHLMLDAMRKVLEKSAEIGIAVLVVDAKDEGLAAYYRAYGFIPFPSQPLRLYLPVATIARALSTPAA